MKISINEPCHESWEAMTPNQQGAFCKSCHKDVVDFSKKTITDIKTFFSKPQEGRVCGRFEEKQLQELSFDDFFSRFRYWNFSRKFAVIFFLAFGFWIFSGSAAMAQSHHIRGEVSIVEEPKPVKKDTVKAFLGQPIIDNRPMIKMGKIKCDKLKETVKKENPKPKNIVKKEEEPILMGDIDISIEDKTPVVKPETNSHKPIDIPPHVKETNVVPNNNNSPTHIPKERRD